MTRADLLAASRAAREVALAADTLAVRLKRLADSAPPPAPLLPAQLATPQPIEASAPVSAHQASEAPSGGAELSLPSGWHAVGDTRWVYGSRFWERSAPRVDRFGNESLRAFTANTGWCVSPWPSTLLQAMCAALGIALQWCQCEENDCKRVSAYLGDEQIAFSDVSDDGCARDALEAFHARQQPTLLGVRAPGCKCRTLPGGARQVNRYCELSEHASEWQTLAEQRSADVHEDGTPRAGCAVCSSPELDRRERGV